MSVYFMLSISIVLLHVSVLVILRSENGETYQIENPYMTIDFLFIYLFFRRSLTNTTPGLTIEKKNV